MVPVLRPMSEAGEDFCLVFTLRTWLSSSKSALRLVYTEDLTIFQLAFNTFSYSGAAFWSSFLQWVSVQVSRDPLYFPVCLFHLRNDGLPYIFSFLKDSKRVADFSVPSAFCFLLGQSGDFKTLYKWNKTPKILDGFFFFYCCCCWFFLGCRGKEILSTWNSELGRCNP